MSTPNHLSEFYQIVGKETQGPSSTAVSSPSRYQRHQPYYNHSTSHSVTSPVSSPIDSTHDPSNFSAPASHHNPSGVPRRSSVSSFGTFASTIGTTNYASGVINNHPDLPALITSREVSETADAYTGVLAAAQKYREALLAVSTAAAGFGAALEDCARCKGAGSSAESLLAAGGLHFLVSNHQQILAKSIQRTFETPVKRQLDLFKSTMAKNDEEFKRELRAKTRKLKQNEMQNAKLLRLRVRNLAEYRMSLLELTSQIDDIDKFKYEHFCQAFDVAQDTSTHILTYAASVVRAEVEIYEGIAKKGWSGGGLEDLIATCPDPFAPNEDEDDDELDSQPPTISRSSNKFVGAIQGLLSASTSMPTISSSSVTIKSLKPKPSFTSASLSLAPAATAGSSPQDHIVKKSTGKGLFSILPSKSILPSFDFKSSATSGSIDSDEEENADVASRATLRGKPKDLANSEEEADGTETIEDKSKESTSNTNGSTVGYYQDESVPSHSLRRSGYGNNSLSSSLSSGFANQVSVSTPISVRKPVLGLIQSSKDEHKHSASSISSSSSSSHNHFGASSSTPRNNHDTHPTDADDMLGYAGWNNSQ